MVVVVMVMMALIGELRLCVAIVVVVSIVSVGVGAVVEHVIHPAVHRRVGAGHGAATAHTYTAAHGRARRQDGGMQRLLLGGGQVRVG